MSKKEAFVGLSHWNLGIFCYCSIIKFILIITLLSNWHLFLLLRIVFKATSVISSPYPQPKPYISNRKTLTSIASLARSGEQSVIINWPKTYISICHLLTTLQSQANHISSLSLFADLWYGNNNDDHICSCFTRMLYNYNIMVHYIKHSYYHWRKLQSLIVIKLDYFSLIFIKFPRNSSQIFALFCINYL